MFFLQIHYVASKLVVALLKFRTKDKHSLRHKPTWHGSGVVFGRPRSGYLVHRVQNISVPVILTKEIGEAPQLAGKPETRH